MSDMNIARAGSPEPQVTAASEPQGPTIAASVVVPTYNEAQNLPELVRRICASLPSVEVVVVDDASKDGTADVARELGKSFPVKVVERVNERGLSTAVLRGLREAQNDICVVMDADLSHPPESIPRMVRAIQDGAEVVVGSRYVR
ncbi:MAG: glycosyltransferase, partial [Planctomycetaceae bacterium]|nr:glycosyltransferase [Planctomycetaceae bacterium]